MVPNLWLASTIAQLFLCSLTTLLWTQGQKADLHCSPLIQLFSLTLDVHLPGMPFLLEAWNTISIRILESFSVLPCMWKCTSMCKCVCVCMCVCVCVYVCVCVCVCTHTPTPTHTNIHTLILKQINGIHAYTKKYRKKRTNQGRT